VGTPPKFIFYELKAKDIWDKVRSYWEHVGDTHWEHMGKNKNPTPLLPSSKRRKKKKARTLSA
jgi:hypothetical protein